MEKLDGLTFHDDSLNHNHTFSSSSMHNNGQDCYVDNGLMNNNQSHYVQHYNTNNQMYSNSANHLEGFYDEEADQIDEFTEEDAELNNYIQDLYNDNSVIDQQQSSQNNSKINTTSDKPFKADNSEKQLTEKLYDVLVKKINNQTIYEYTCVLCKQVIIGSKEILIHLKEVHGRENECWECKMCDFASRHRASLNRHIRTVHHNIPRTKSAKEREASRNSKRRRLSKLNGEASLNNTDGRLNDTNSSLNVTREQTSQEQPSTSLNPSNIKVESGLNANEPNSTASNHNSERSYVNILPKSNVISSPSRRVILGQQMHHFGYRRRNIKILPRPSYVDQTRMKINKLLNGKVGFSTSHFKINKILSDREKENNQINQVILPPNASTSSQSNNPGFTFKSPESNQPGSTSSRFNTSNAMANPSHNQFHTDQSSQNDLNDMKAKFEQHESRLVNLETNFSSLNKSVANLDTRLTTLDSRMNRMEDKLDAILKQLQKS